MCAQSSEVAQLTSRANQLTTTCLNDYFFSAADECLRETSSFEAVSNRLVHTKNHKATDVEDGTGNDDSAGVDSIVVGRLNDIPSLAQ